MLNPDAADGVLLLNEEVPHHIRALTALADVVGRIRNKASELSAKYDLKATLLDLSALQREWTEACASNVLVRSGRKKQPYCLGEVPEEIGRDLIVLQDLCELLRGLEALRPHFRGIERLWRGLDSDPARIAALIKWARDLQTAVDAFQIDDVPPERITAHVAGLLAHDISRFRSGGQVRKKSG